MRQKSKLLAFLLSFIPGLGHFYIGYADRGLIYLILAGVGCGGSIVLGLLSSSEFFLFTLFAAYALIWLIALIDSFNLINQIRYGAINRNLEEELGEEGVKMMNRKIITLGLSLIPGAGHMYLGYQKKGLAYMGMFFFTIFFMGWLNLSFLLFLIPLIWFYAFFDAFHTVNENTLEDSQVDIVNLLPKIGHKYIGIGLVVIGLIVIFQNLIFPIIGEFIGYRYRNFIQSFIVSLAFIIIGIKMLRGKKMVELEDEDNED